MSDKICGDCSHTYNHQLHPESKVICKVGYGVRGMKKAGCKRFEPLAPGKLRQDVDCSEAFDKSKKPTPLGRAEW